MFADFYQRLFDWAGGYAWVMQAFAVVFVLLLCDLLLRLVLRRLGARLQRTKNPWDDAIAAAVQRPATLLIWVIGLTFAMEIAYADTEIAVHKIVAPLRTIGVVGALTWFLTGIIRRFQIIIVTHPDKNKRRLDLATVNAIGKLLRASILITAGLVTLQTLGFSVSGVLAFGGIGGIAVGFAARDLLANFFGGLMLYLDRPFAIGDVVRSPDRAIEGTVEDIGWRITRIRAFDMQPIYVPNGVFSTMIIVNRTRMTHRRIHTTVGLRYADADKMEAIVAAVKEMLVAHPKLDQSQVLIANFDEFAASSLDFFIYVYTRTTDWTEFHAVKQEILFAVLDIVAAHGAEIAFPTTTVDLPEAARLQSPPTPPAVAPAKSTTTPGGEPRNRRI